MLLREKVKGAHRPAERAAADGRVLVIDPSADAALWHTMHTLLRAGAAGTAGAASGQAGGHQEGKSSMAVFLGPRLFALLDTPMGGSSSAQPSVTGSAPPARAAASASAEAFAEAVADALANGRTAADALRAAQLSVTRRPVPAQARAAADAAAEGSATTTPPGGSSGELGLDGAVRDVPGLSAEPNATTGAIAGLRGAAALGSKARVRALFATAPKAAAAAAAAAAGRGLRLDVELAAPDSAAVRASEEDGVLRAAHARAARLLWHRHVSDAALRVDVAAHLALLPAEEAEVEGAPPGAGSGGGGDGAARSVAVVADGGGEAARLLTSFALVALFGAAEPVLPLLLLAHALLGARATALRALLFARRAPPLGTPHYRPAASSLALHARALGWLGLLSPVCTVALLLLNSPLLECMLAPASGQLAQLLPQPVRTCALAPSHRSCCMLSAHAPRKAAHPAPQPLVSLPPLLTSAPFRPSPCSLSAAAHHVDTSTGGARSSGRGRTVGSAWAVPARLDNHSARGADGSRAHPSRRALDLPVRDAVPLRKS